LTLFFPNSRLSLVFFEMWLSGKASAEARAAS
jgi:hypothetical protein